MTGNEPNEQRRFSRIPFQARVRLSGARGDAETDLLDLSLKGALVRRPEGWIPAIGEHFRLQLQLDADQEAMIGMDVEVAHEEDDQIGFRCHHIDLDSITHLRRLIELNLGDPELLNRELAALG